MNLYDEAMSHADADHQEADRERAYRIREERDEKIENSALMRGFKIPLEILESLSVMPENSVLSKGMTGEVDGFEIYKPGEPLLPKMMGEDFKNFFHTEEEDQKQAKYVWDALHPI